MNRIPMWLMFGLAPVIWNAVAHPFELLTPAEWAPVATQAVAVAEVLHADLARAPMAGDDLVAWLDAFADALGVAGGGDGSVAIVAAELRRVTGVHDSVATDAVLVLAWRGVLVDLALLAGYARQPDARPVDALPAVGWRTPAELGPEIAAAIERLEQMARGGTR